MRERRARLFSGARVASGVIGIAVGVGVIAAAALVPLPTLGQKPVGLSIVPVPTSAQLVCPGSVLRLGDESGANATEASPIGIPTLTLSADSGVPESVPLAATDAGTALGAPTLLGASSPETSIAGAASQSIDTADYRGFTAAGCGAPSSDSWVVGGSTATGRTALLTLVNPGAVASTVALDVFTENGRVDAPGMTGILVAAQSQRVVSLAGFAPSFESLAVHVTSRGGPVLASIQQTVVRGIDPGGVDIVGEAAAPATRQVIPGVVISDSLGVQQVLGEDGFADLTTVLRVFAPGDVPTELRVQIVPDEATVMADDGATGFSLAIETGVVVDVPIDDLDDGSYTVIVDSDAAVIAAVRASTATDGVTDLSWFAAASPLTADSFFAVAAGPNPALSLSNTSPATITATLDGQPVVVAAGAAVRVPVVANRTYLLGSAVGLYASVSFADVGELGAYPISPAAAGGGPITVYP